MSETSTESLSVSGSVAELAASADAVHPSDIPRDASSANAPIDGGGSPCPTPLAWQEVVRQVQEQSDAWKVDGALSLSGRTLGSGRPIYLLGGAMADSELMSLLAWLLRDDYRCVMVDYPQIPLPPGRLSIERLANALLEVADRHGDDRFSIYGSSLGAAVALQTLCDSPQRVSGVVLHAASAQLELSFGERLALWLAGYSRRPIGRWSGVVEVLRRNHRRWFPPFDTTRWDFLERQLAATRADVFAQRARAHAKADLKPRLSQIELPVVLLGTEGDGRVLQRNREQLAAALSKCDVRDMDATGHFPHLTHPHRLAKLIRDVCPMTSGDTPREHDRD